MIRHLLSRIAVLAALTSTALAQQSQAHGGMSSGSSSGGHAPEIDVALVGAALALIVGGVLVFTTARRRKLARS